MKKMLIFYLLVNLVNELANAKKYSGNFFRI